MPADGLVGQTSRAKESRAEFALQQPSRVRTELRSAAVGKDRAKKSSEKQSSHITDCMTRAGLERSPKHRRSVALYGSMWSWLLITLCAIAFPSAAALSHAHTVCGQVIKSEVPRDHDRKDRLTDTMLIHPTSVSLTLIPRPRSPPHMRQHRREIRACVKARGLR